MEITIKLQDIIGDMGQAREDIFVMVKDEIVKNFESEIKKAVNSEMERSLKEVVSKVVYELLNSHLDTIITMTDEYGRVKDTETVRNRIAKIMADSCQYKLNNYSSEKNAFTRVVDECVASEVKKYKAELTATVNKMIVAECLNATMEKLKSTMGIK